MLKTACQAHYDSIPAKNHLSGTELFVIQAIVHLIFSEFTYEHCIKDSTTIDFAAGTGGFLVDGINHMREQIQPGDVEAEKTIQKSISACEWKPLPYMLLTTNLLLHGIELPNVYYGSALDRRLSDYSAKDQVDREAMNPPYGGVASAANQMNFPADKRSSETFDLFVQLMIIQFKLTDILQRKMTDLSKTGMGAYG